MPCVISCSTYRPTRASAAFARESVKDHLTVGPGHLVPAGIDVGRPHVQADRLDIVPVFNRKGDGTALISANVRLFNDLSPPGNLHFHRGRDLSR